MIRMGLYLRYRALFIVPIRKVVPGKNSVKLHHLLIIIFAEFLAASHYFGYTPLALSVIFLVSSSLTYFLYAKDKAAAVAGTRRVPENTLHAAALWFGWPGALIAQQRLRHKTKKRGFRAVFWFTLLINFCGVLWLHGLQGNYLLRQAALQVEDTATAHIPNRMTVSVLVLLTMLHNRN